MTNVSVRPGRRNFWFWLVVLVAVLTFIFAIRSVLLPFVLGMATAYFLDPAVDALQRARLSRNSATLVVTAAFFSLIVMVLVIGAPLLSAQVDALLQALPGYIAQFDQEILPAWEQRLKGVSPALLQELRGGITSSSGLVARAAADFFGNLLTSGVAFVNLVSLILITPIVAFYLLRDWDEVVTKVDALLPRRHAVVIREQCQIINQTLAGFVRGQLNVCILLGLYYAIGLSLVGLNFGFIIGFTTGLLVVFPYVGLLVGAMVGLALAVIQFGDMQSVLMVLLVFVSGQVIEGNFVTPKLVGNRVGLHPVWVIFAMLAGGAMFGFVGVLLAVPVAAVVGVLVRFALGEYQKSSYFQA